MLLTLELFPGQGLGNFTLGMPLYEAVNLIRKKRSDFSCVEVKYATQALFDQDIVINFPEHGMHLRFEPRSQRLRLVEVYDVSRLQASSPLAVTGGASHPSTFVRVYDIFGPTYPGEYDEHNRMYSLHYPGVVFLFPIPEQHAERCSESHIELPLEFPDGSTPLAARICVHAAAEATAQLITMAAPPPLPADSLYFEVVEARLRQGLHFRRGGQTVRFGDSPQDIWSELGPPSGTSAKRMDTMLIHMKQAPVTGADYFYSYHSRGLDILFSGKTHTVRKFVLHTNVPGHPDFNVYAKCNFTLQQMPEPQAGASRGPTITADSTWDEVQQVLGDGGRATIHSRGFASNPFGPTLVYGYRGVAFEALKNGHLAGLTLFQA
ncbi:UPF0183-domain-containing protein [Coccomyxa subellipsoidea C-169]|uniref:UPF0183-domain-containing protein n=1 Tax=Coccomyxa subellipsoidea (strain C-169) TaxID=574566 RepID=I0YJM9_COCSC|nr:UPF0183-domain-containing protein [Coccomyxa subellipsoidea C-169]EIE18598.1 UPF0183-domain-containing protein [Coccomyxa subellipsoidea C-169]|eukprot:XP_005643142.1 UPF0183-domain-containing protein [Coccomyxa subellipsoidea C-169]